MVGLNFNLFNMFMSCNVWYLVSLTIHGYKMFVCLFCFGGCFIENISFMK